MRERKKTHNCKKQENCIGNPFFLLLIDQQDNFLNFFSPKKIKENKGKAKLLLVSTSLCGAFKLNDENHFLSYLLQQTIV